jgi:hypothetical protein
MRNSTIDCESWEYLASIPPGRMFQKHNSEVNYRLWK